MRKREREREGRGRRKRAPPIVVVSCFAFPSCLLRLSLAYMLCVVTYVTNGFYVDECIEIHTHTHTNTRQVCTVYTRLDEYSDRQFTEEEEETTTIFPTVSVKEKSLLAKMISESFCRHSSLCLSGRSTPKEKETSVSFHSLFPQFLSVSFSFYFFIFNQPPFTVCGPN